MTDAQTDPLVHLLPTPADTGRPWLVWYADQERIELSGRVLSMWQAKTAGLLTDEIGERPHVHVAMSTHWRTVAWCCGTWLAGGLVRFSTSDGVSGVSPTAAVAPVGPDSASVAFDARDLDPRAGVQVLVPRASLALRHPEALEPLVLDGVADLMALPDVFPPVPVEGHAPALVSGGGGVAWTRRELVDSLPEHRALKARETGTRAVMIEEGTPMAVLEVLAAWRHGLSAVMVDASAESALRTAAARQEGALP
ncbi:MAG: TIGR03089 family protein [Actinomyces sp.]|uniref:TIGR03089 family protein n=1 Tax=Actinomyces sp. TaxID=29317 RepID=UPI0026DB068C|nr:TIGR03089 family protein [Actinomyces sp.]MDO4242256.1 TIGR03089 family protein [Actinomyces sp.]